MSGFTATWSRARATFGTGAPDGENPLDGNDVARARVWAGNAVPGEGWQGAASDAYAEEHLRQVSALGRVPDLDARVSDEIARSTAVVAAGRRSLDEVLDWALAVDAAAPGGEAGELIRHVLAARGIEHITTIVQQSSAQLDTIGSRLRALGVEYQDVTRAAEYKQNPPGEPDVTAEDNRTHEEKVAEWVTKVDLWNKKVADLWATRPPDGMPPGPATEAWSQRRRELMKEQAELVQEGVEIGIEMPPPPEGPIVAPPAGVPGAIASGPLSATDRRTGRL